MILHNSCWPVQRFWGQRSVAVFVHWSMCHLKLPQWSIITKHPFLSAPYHWWIVKGKDSQKANETIRWRAIALQPYTERSLSLHRGLLAVRLTELPSATAPTPGLSSSVSENIQQDVVFKGDMQRFTPGPFAPQPRKRPQCATCTYTDPRPYSRGGAGKWTISVPSHFFTFGTQFVEYR